MDSLRLQLQGLRRSSQELKLSLLGSGQSLSAHVFGACELLPDILRHGRGSLLVSKCTGPEHFAKSYLCHAFLQLTSVSLVHVVSSVCRLLLELAGLHVLAKSAFDVFCLFVVKHAESCPTLATLYQRFELNPMHGQSMSTCHLSNHIPSAHAERRWDLEVKRGCRHVCFEQENHFP